MNNYEALFIIKPDLKDADAENVYKAVQEMIAKNSGAFVKDEKWGKRPLAYPVKKSREGVYYKVDFQSPPASIVKMREAFALNMEILRVMITKR